MAQEIIFDCEVVTPMFLGGADQQAELRASAIKGAMRWWFRAMMGDEDMSKLKESESEVFGSSDRGRSTFSIRNSTRMSPIKSALPRHEAEVAGKRFKINILDYLAYGPAAFEKGRGIVLKRDYLPPHGEFDLKLAFRDPKHLNAILKAMLMLVRFGGLGARSRNGYGSIHIIASVPSVAEMGVDPQLDLSRLAATKDEIPTFSAFSKHIKLFQARTVHSTWDKALAEIGLAYRESRLELERRHFFDKRQYIGAPIYEGKVRKSRLERRAKPYFLNVRKLSNGFRGQILFLPSAYCCGLDKDADGKAISHTQVNSDFLKSCAEINSNLSKKLNEVL